MCSVCEGERGEISCDPTKNQGNGEKERRKGNVMGMRGQDF